MARRNYDIVRQLKIERNVNELAKMARLHNKRLNQRFRELEKKGLTKESYAYQRAVIETGRERPRYTEAVSKLSKMDLDTLYKEAIDVAVKLDSDTTSLKGLYEIRNKKLQSTVDTLQGYGIDIEKNDLIDFFANNGGMLLNSKYLDSLQILDDFVEFSKNGNVSVDEFVKTYKWYNSRAKNNPVDYGKVRKNLIRKSKK